MPIPRPAYNRQTAMLILSETYDKLCEQHSACMPRNGIPVGGGDWMDSFFRMEGVRGALTCLRNGGTLTKAIADGKLLSEIAVRLWNNRREYQVRRWDKTCHDFLDSLERRIRSQT